jgi:hypothetical protein
MRKNVDPQHAVTASSAAVASSVRRRDSGTTARYPVTGTAQAEVLRRASFDERRVLVRLDLRRSSAPCELSGQTMLRMTVLPWGAIEPGLGLELAT